MWLLSKQVNSIIYFCILIFASLFIIWGNLFITISCYALLGLWILEGNYKEKIKTLYTAKTPLFFLSIFFVTILWALPQLPHQEAINDVWETAPLFTFALVLGSKARLTRKQFHVLLLLFVVSITLNTLFNFIYYISTSKAYSDVRNVSYFMSYIRLSLYTLMGALISVYYLFYNTHIQISKLEKRFLWACLLWLTFFVIFLGSLTGYIAVLSLSVVFALAESLKQKQLRAKIVAIALVTLLIFSVFGAFMHELRLFTQPDQIVPSELDSVSLLGNSYKPFNTKGTLENAHWVNLYICEKEINESWPLYSKISIWGKDTKGENIRSTLYRYLTSKNLRKDASGLKQLLPDEIRLIESGCTNYRFDDNYNFLHRIYEVIWEFHVYSQGGNPAGHSVTQRMEFIKCAIAVIKNNTIWGTGPAKVGTELYNQYQKQEVVLPKIYWHKPHNQFILFALQYGIIGFIIIILSMFSILYFGLREHISMLSISWIVITGISFLNEDMLDGINGLVFFAYFGSLFLFCQPLPRK